MDDSKTFIKMMTKAWPFLKEDMPIGSLLFPRRLRMLYVLDGKVVYWRDEVNKSNCDRAIPLLEQDQLQEMVGCLPVNIGWLYRDFAHNYDYRLDHKEPFEIFPTWEQLWLASVCYEKYNRIWNDEDWIKIERRTNA